MPDIIETNPKVMHGQPVIKGTRIPVARIVALHAMGYKLKDFKRDYPYLELTNEDLMHIFQYFADQLAKKKTS